MPWQPLPFIGGAYTDDALPWSAQDTLNYIPVPAERGGTRSVAKLVGVPGMVTVTASMQEAPVRGLHNVEGLLLAVTGDKLYSIGTDGAATSIGTIPGVGRVSMAHNQITGGFQVAIANGQSGYVYDTSVGTLTQITDDGFPGAKVFDFVDGYMAYVEPFGRFWGHSDLLDAASYNTLDRYDAESAPDKMQSLIVSHREVMVLNQRTCAFFRNTGATTGTFANNNGTEMEVGCASPYAVARLDNTVYWLGNDNTVYRLEGHAPRRVSTGPIEQAIARCNAANAFSFTFEDRGHKVFYLTFPDGQTWGYDVWTNEWHRRGSEGLDRWRVSALVRWRGKWIAGDYSNGKLYELDWDVQHEAGYVLERCRRGGVLHANQNRLTVNALELVIDTGVSKARPGQPIIISGEFDGGTVGVDYSSGPLTASGGTAPYTWSAEGLTLGLEMQPDGVITGTPTASGTITCDVTARDRYGRTATVSKTIEIVYGSSLAVSYGTSIGIYSGTTADYPLAYTISGANISTDCEFAFSDGGEYLAVSNFDVPYFRLYQRNAEGAYIETATPLDVMPAARVAAVALTSDASYLFISESTILRVYKRVGTTFQQIYTKITGDFSYGAKWSPSGEYLAATMNSSADGYLAIFRRSGDTISQLSYSDDWDGISVAWNKAGDRIAFARRNAGVRVISVDGDTCTKLNTDTGTSPGNCQVRWAADGQHLYLAGNLASPAGVYLWVVLWNGVALTRLTDPVDQPPTVVDAADLSVDGRLLSLVGSGYCYLYEVDGVTVTKLDASGITQTNASHEVAFLESSDHWLP